MKPKLTTAAVREAAMRSIGKLALVLAFSSLASCASSPQAQDPFDVALGLAALGIMNDQAPSDATMQSFSRAVAPPVIQQTTIVQEAPKKEVTP